MTPAEKELLEAARQVAFFEGLTDKNLQRLISAVCSCDEAARDRGEDEDEDEDEDDGEGR